MRLLTYSDGSSTAPGIALEGFVYATRDVAYTAGLAAAGLNTNRDVLEAGPEWLKSLTEAAHRMVAHERLQPVGALDDVKLGPPVPDPRKIVCLGLNYRDHAAEAGLPLPEVPMLFAKYANSLVGPDDPIVALAASAAIDYEVELAVVIGQRCKDVDEAQALEVVAGVTAFNDVSARDLQTQTTQFTAGKAIDTFGPCGPTLVPLDQISDIQNLGLRTRVNGRTVQDGSTSQMIFSVATTIAFLSRIMTLEPGDIIATGTPAGVGFKREPPVLLVPGDVVEVEVDEVGTLRNEMVAADAARDGSPVLSRTA